MEGCGHCESAKIALDSEINSGIIRKIPHTNAPADLRAFPHFVNNDNGKAVTGWPRNKEELYKQLDYVVQNTPFQDFQAQMEQQQAQQVFLDQLRYAEQQQAQEQAQQQAHQQAQQVFLDQLRYAEPPTLPPMFDQIGYAPQLPPKEFFEHFGMEKCSSYPVVETMQTVSTDVLYHKHTGGYSKLNDCWVKKADYTS